MVSCSGALRVQHCCEVLGLLFGQIVELFCEVVAGSGAAREAVLLLTAEAALEELAPDGRRCRRRR